MAAAAEAVPFAGGDPSAMTWWASSFARIYDLSLWPGEHAGMRQQRRTLLAQAQGRVLEIGAGTGLNVPHYPSEISELILSEPDDAMCRRLVQRADGRATVVAARADELPVADASLDTVVSTFVLCTVEEPEAALREIRRVLRRPWSRFACGCRCDQPTVDLLRASGFRAELRPARWRAMPPVVRPIVVGRAFVG